MLENGRVPFTDLSNTEVISHVLGAYSFKCAYSLAGNVLERPAKASDALWQLMVPPNSFINT